MVYQASLSTQRNKYEQIQWSAANGVNGRETAMTPAVGYTQTFTGRPAGHVHTNKPYYEFTLHVTAASGIEIRNLVMRDTQGPGSTEPICEEITFTDLECEFAGGTVTPFDVSAALSNNPVLKIGENGKLGTDDNFQYGILLVLRDDFGGTCPVEIELSVVLRGDVNDFDPTSAFDGCKIYPQISFTWDRGGSRRVQRFRGSTRLVVSTAMPPGHMGHPSGGNVASFYTDSNSSLDYTEFRNHSAHYRLIQGVGAVAASFFAAPFGPGVQLLAVIAALYGANRFPDWNVIFDYARNALIHELEIVGAYGPNDGNNSRGDSYHADSRSQDYEWPQGTTLGVDMGVTKTPRQGYYDNMHVHGRMQAQTRSGDEKCHAPFCIHSCMHLHWRWSSLNHTLALLAFHPDRDIFAGWAKSWWSGTWWSNNEAGAPMIPPNQRLVVSLTHPSSTRPSGGGSVANPATSLDSNLKAAWYTVDVQKSREFSLPAGKKQVTFDHGLGWAYRLADSLTPPGLTPMTVAQFFDVLYDYLRYFDGDLGVPDETGPQIPQGDYTVGGTVISMEEL